MAVRSQQLQTAHFPQEHSPLEARRALEQIEDSPPDLLAQNITKEFQTQTCKLSF